ncbi:proline iminopeptidase-family hydrolase [Sphingomicrobium nitratireducens]|uniref:proline iminopeptidase-family hydrolase n=1 Tax=Sphingomicrobium nitratireducens TaxID=2964666 RepID=UPI00223EB9D9|nr:proline iminopeptidase-family hydrolase [Sphingomicrobium nitratireducens]
MRSSLFAAVAALALSVPASADAPPASYYETKGRPDSWSGGVTMLPIETEAGTFKVWLKRHGNNPDYKLLLLHGGPAMGHDFLEVMDAYLPQTGIEFYQYDQLGSGWSDRPDNDDLWTIERYVDEVDQVREAIDGDASNFCLFGTSWGGILAIEYALAHPDKVKCLVISNMMASIPAYNAYAKDVLIPQKDPEQVALVLQLEKEGKTDDPRYEETLVPMWYEQHVIRRPHDQWPHGLLRTFSRANMHIYTLMQGPSEMGASGRLADWDRTADLHKIDVPTLVISGKYDTMDPAHMAWMAETLPKGELLATEGSHLSMYDDQDTYFGGLIAFLEKMKD